jgi:GntR family transcriptional regulator
LEINPNTAQKVIAELARARLLAVHPGIGTVVTPGRPASSADRQQHLSREVEHLIVEAKRLGLTKSEVTGAVAARWSALFEAKARSED